MEKLYHDELRSNISYLFKKGVFVEKSVFLFGHCDATEKMIDELLARNVIPDGIADNNENKSGFCYRGITVQKPERLLITEPQDTIILIASRAFESMKAQCNKMGYLNVQKIVNYNTFSGFSLEEDVVQKKKERLKRGLDIYSDIKAAYPSHYIGICPYNAMGDVYEALRYFPIYQKKKNIGNYVMVVQGDVPVQIAEMFHTENIINLGRKEMDELQQAVIFSQDDNTEILHHDRPFYTNIAIRLSNRCGVTFDEHYRVGLYGLPVDEKGVLPDKGNRTDFPELVKGNSVIISPYAKSMVGMPEEYWNKKVQEYKNKGLHVYTNISGEEQPLHDTTAVRYPVKDMIRAAEYAGYFLGIRNGLCDVIQSADCEKEIVFPDSIYSTTNMKVEEFFRMEL